MPSRNEPCPCGSGKKFKKCCLNKRFSFEENADGTFDKSVPIDSNLARLLEQQIDSLGENPPPDTRLFGSMNLEGVEHGISMAMKQAGIDPAIIYAFEETGMMVSEENMDLFSQKDLDLWQSKIDEYRSRTANKKSNVEFPIGTVANYGPDDKHTTKIVAAVILHPTAEPILRRFVGSNISKDPKVMREIVEFFSGYKVKKTVLVKENIGCPHEEGEDFPVGEDCPFCPYWAGKQGSNSAPF